VPNCQAWEELKDEKAAQELSASGLSKVMDWDVTDKDGWTLVGGKKINGNKM